MTTLRPGTDIKRNYEIYFPNSHVAYDPCGPLRFPVLNLCHATHDSEAAQIQEIHCNLFTPRQKTGKSYIPGSGYHSYGESYCCTVQTPNPDMECYQPIFPAEPIFPGYYSWWGLDVEVHLRPSWIESRILPHYLKTPVESVYGRNAFLYGFNELLESYAMSRGCGVGDVYLKLGGTLRYKCEIAYVVIVCTSSDCEILHNYPPITQSKVLDSDHLVDENGKICNPHQGLYFATRHMNRYFAYETLNFAFYFSFGHKFRCSPKQPLMITHDYCVRHGKVCPQKHRLYMEL